MQQGVKFTVALREIRWVLLALCFDFTHTAHNGPIDSHKYILTSPVMATVAIFSRLITH